MDGSDIPEISEGDLQSYIEGERAAHVVAALERSPDLRRELEHLERANRRMHGLFGGATVPGDLDMIDVAAGQATPLQHLRVAAYLRESLAGRRKMAYLLEGKGATRQPRPLVLAMPPLAFGLKGGAVPEQEGPVFMAAELAAQVILQISPHDANTWTIRGYLEHAGAPLVTARVALRVLEGPRRQRTTDMGGFFRFEHLPAGNYYLRIVLPDGVMLTPPIRLPYTE